MDWYLLVKFLHVTAALIWVGGGFAMMVMATLADRARDTERTLAAIHAMDYLGARLMVPAALFTFLTGLTMSWLWIGFLELWILIGLAGFATTFLIGLLVFKPAGERLAAMLAEQGLSPAVLAQGRQLLKLARFDYAAMFVIVASMVLKPGATDVVVLTGMAVVLLAGAAAAFGNWSAAEAAAEA